MEKGKKVSSKKTILSDEYSKFKTDHSNSFSSWINPREYDLPEIFKNYEYPVSSWPVIIASEEAKMLEALCVRIPSLIQKLPEYYFKNDSQKIADFYFKGNKMLAEFALMAHQKEVEVGCRLDLTLTNKGFKILEANIGSSIGGWQVQSFEYILQKLHPVLEGGIKSEDYTCQNTQQNYMSFLVDNVLEKVSSKEEKVNVFISLGHVKDIDIRKKSEAFFNQLFQEELQRRGYHGQAYIADYKTLKMHKGKLHMNNIQVYGVIILSLDRQEMPSDIFRSFLMGSIYFPDHLGITMYGDKRNLELLRNLATQQKFSEADNELVLNSIPWTQNITKDSKILHKGKEEILVEVLKDNKDDFVIKAANGYQGEDVFVGNFLSSEEWEKAIDIAKTTNSFIAQEFCDSDSFNAPNKNGEWTPHKLIWGAFGFGKNYGGVWVRMSEEKTDTGVINSATGAVEAIVYEKMSFDVLTL